MLRKGFLTENQARSDRFQVQAADLNLKNLREQLRVLKNHTKKRNVTDLEGKRDEIVALYRHSATSHEPAS